MKRTTSIRPTDGTNSIKRRGSILWNRLLAVIGGFALNIVPTPLYAETPEDNSVLYGVHGSLVGVQIGANAGGFAPPPFGTAFETLGLATDAALKVTPAVFRPPSDQARHPNVALPGPTELFECAYRFDRPTNANFISQGIESEYSSLFGLSLFKVDNKFGELTNPFVYHGGADVAVRAKHPSLSQMTPLPVFTEGVHEIEWEAATRLNPIIDIAVPTALAASSAFAEFQATRPGVSKSTKNFYEYLGFIIDVVDTAVSFSDSSNSLAVLDWYQRTTLDTAYNRASQMFTVFDTHAPYILDLRSGNSRVTEQLLEMEATDFGGIRFERVEAFLRAQFMPVDDCNREMSIVTDTSPRRLLSLDNDNNDIVWTALETDSGPYPGGFPLAANQTRIGDGIETSFTQRITVRDTQAPILVPPAGFAVESNVAIDISGDSFPLGRPRVVDLADPAPGVSNDAPDTLEVGRRYAINWTASDASGNVSVTGPNSPGALTQIVTVKAPGTNTAPTALPVTPINAVTSQAVDIRLQGNDVDIIDDIADPLEFRIDTYPENGEFEAPLFPFFIRDFRLTPLGEREEGDDLSRTSPLLHLASDLLDRVDHGAFLSTAICDAPAGSLEANIFGNEIPVDFVYEPQFIQPDNAGNTYIVDFFWKCGEPTDFFAPEHTVTAPIPRVSKWTDDGEFLGMRELTRLVTDPSPDFEHTGFLWPARELFIDSQDRLWIPIGIRSRTTTDDPIRLSLRTFLTMDSDLQNLEYIGFDPEASLDYWNHIASTADDEQGLFYQVRPFPDTVPPAPLDARFDQVSVFPTDVPDGAAFLEPFQPLVAINGDGTVAMAATDVKLDSQNNVYIVDNHRHRIHKFQAVTTTSNGDLVAGDYVGWLGACSGNALNNQGVPFSACDEARQISLGFSCTDATCLRSFDAGSEPGQFDEPFKLAIDGNDVLYVSDRNNARIQRFRNDGTFAGEAVSTGTGINQGAEPGFILGNFGNPELLSVSSSGLFVLETQPQFGDYFVHVFKTLPFFDVSDDSATVRYISGFNFQGQDSFSFITDDGIAESPPEAVTVSVTRAFRAPERLTTTCYDDPQLTNPIACEVDEDSSLIIRLSASDPDGFISTGGLDSLTFDVQQAPMNGSLELLTVTENAAVYRYTPVTDYFGDDALTFTASDGIRTADAPATAYLTVLPTPDPMVIAFTHDGLAARGFEQLVTAEFSDVDNDPLADNTLTLWNWGDGSVANGPNWTDSGRQDLNGRQLSPQIDAGFGAGTLVASHRYDAVGSYTIAATMENLIADGLGPTVATATIDVIDATVLRAELIDAKPMQLIDPDIPFSLALRVRNEQPTGWSGLTSNNIAVTFSPPPGLVLSALDSRCTLASLITCNLDSLAPGAEATFTMTGEVSLQAARDSVAYSFQVRIDDDETNLGDANFGFAALEIRDTDNDGFIDADDMFPDDPRYASDTDGDGLPDAWERLFGLDPDIADDPLDDIDNDLTSLIDEFRTGLSPRLQDAQTIVPGNTVAAPGSSGDDGFGTWVTGADLNGDVFADVLIGAPKWQGVGAVFGAFGSPEGASDAVPMFAANAGESNFGQSIVLADFNNSGYDDLAIAASNGISIYDNNGGLYPTPDRILPVFDTPTQLAIKLASGDLDNDGIPDLIVIAKLGLVATQFQLYLSSRGGVTTAPTTYITNDVALGDAALIADIDADGLNDLVLGGSSTDSGYVHIYLAIDNDWTEAGGLNNSQTLVPLQGETGFGHSLATRRAANDTVDLAVGAFGGRGFVNIYSARDRYWEDPTVLPFRLIGALSQFNPQDLYGTQLGYSLASADINSDGEDDFVSGTNRVGAFDEGGIATFRSFVGWTRHTGDSQWDQLGFHIAIPGDINGDGFADVIAGAPDPMTPERPAPDGGYAQFFYYSSAPFPGEVDTDSDRISDTFDNCPADANLGQSDIDGDGLGDACDLDIDADGIPNAIDVCPATSDPLQLDFDGDFLGDNCDPDDDNDRVTDDEDRFPLDDRYSLDSDNDGIADRFEIDAGLNPSDASDASQDADGDGRSNLEEFLADGDPNADDVAPEISVPTALLIDATGPLTPIDAGTATATDFRDGAVAATTDAPAVFRPGRHIITWQARDLSGNAVSAQQTIDVMPLASFDIAQPYVAEGGDIELVVRLNGPAITYPVVLPLEITGTAVNGQDFTISASEIRIDSGDRSSVNLSTLSDATSEGDEDIVVRLLPAVNAVIAAIDTQIVTIVERNLPPRVTLNIEQNNEPRTTVIANDGLVSMLAGVNDVNVSDSHSFDWSGSDPMLMPSEGFSAATFTFDPSGLTDGIYRVALTVSDGAESSAVERYIKVLSAAPTLLSTEDADGDGIDDQSEGVGDSAGNGVPAYLDPFSAARWVPGTSGQSDLAQTPTGRRLQLGVIALVSGADARVTFDDIAAGGTGGSPTANAADSSHNYPTGLFDLTVSDLANAGDRALFVTALPVPIPSDALYRVYTANAGWRSVDFGSPNAISSAPGAPGTCPAPGSTDYVTGLNVGHHCVQLTIADGGPGDTDGQANRSVSVTGGVAVRAEGLSVMTMELAQPPNQTVADGAMQVPVLRFRLNSNSDDIVLRSLTLAVSGTGNDSADIRAVRVWQDYNGDGVIDASDAEIGSGRFDTDNGTLAITLNTPLPVPMGDIDIVISLDF